MSDHTTAIVVALHVVVVDALGPQLVVVVLLLVDVVGGALPRLME